MPQFIYTMKGLGKVHPPDTRVLDDIWLSFYFGAKIGVLGLNGAGKSTLLRIMAGVERQFAGETHCSPGYTIGFLEQEPTLDASKTVIEIVREGVQELADLLREFEEISAKFAEPMSDDEMNALLALATFPMALKIHRVICPFGAGVTSALGMLVAALYRRHLISSSPLVTATPARMFMFCWLVPRA